MSAVEVAKAQLERVRIEPDSPEMKAQSLLKSRSISERVLILGRRGTRRYISADADEADHLIANPYPYTISRQHCEIVRGEGEVIVRDLNSRFGTLVNGKRLIRRNGRMAEIFLQAGEHSLVLGRSQGSVRFRLIVGEA